jgi:hypothetical protein
MHRRSSVHSPHKPQSAAPLVSSRSVPANFAAHCSDPVKAVAAATATATAPSADEHKPGAISRAVPGAELHPASCGRAHVRLPRCFASALLLCLCLELLVGLGARDGSSRARICGDCCRTHAEERFRMGGVFR